MPRLRLSDYARPADELAQALLGALLVRTLADGTHLSGVIVETEAYLGPDDTCSHAHNNRRTARTEPMFGKPGLAYVYFTYGMHHCMNVVCGRNDLPHAVLIRALRPVEGLDRMHAARARPGAKRALRDRDLCSGPGKLCQALAIDRDLSGVDMTVRGANGGHPPIFLERGHRIAPADIAVSTRVGVENGGSWASRPLRWLLRDDPNVSRPP